MSCSGKTLPPIGAPGLAPFTSIKKKEKKSKPKFLGKTQDSFRPGTDHPLLEPISAGPRAASRVEPLREAASPRESEPSAPYGQSHGNDLGIADDSLDDDAFDALAAAPDARRSRDLSRPIDKSLQGFTFVGDTKESSGKGSHIGGMDGEGERGVCEGSAGYSEDDPSNMSELSSEEHSVCESLSTPAAGPVTRSRSRKQSAPWRVLKPIVLKPFISIQREES